MRPKQKTSHEGGKRYAVMVPLIESNNRDSVVMKQIEYFYRSIKRAFLKIVDETSRGLSGIEHR